MKMERTIYGKISMLRRYLPYNKISNMIYMVNYSLVLKIFNTPPQAKRRI